MYSVYMNNFRGFTRTVVPLRKVNFFVGENSTGKTSLLGLIELFANPEFWYDYNFNAGSYEFGGHKDIASALSGQMEEFQVGLCNRHETQKDLNATHLLRFSAANDGSPVLAAYSMLCDHFFLIVRIEENKIRGYASTEVPGACACCGAKDCFSFLDDMTAQSMQKLKPIKGDGHFIRRSLQFSLPMIIDELLPGARKAQDKVPVINPRLLRYPGFRPDLVCLAPIRTTPKRSYDGYAKRFSPDGEHTPYVIRQQLQARKGKGNSFTQELETFGKESGLFKTVGVTAYGKDSDSPFDLTVKLGTKRLRINSVGYGVSQVLPIVVEVLNTGSGTWSAVQQPEVHLHPKAQAALGDVFFQAATDKDQTFFIETHSDYLIDRFRLKMRDHEHPKDFAQVIYFERAGNGNRLYPIVLDHDGEYPEDQPKGFRSFFLSEHKRILGV